jgi:hypothetical protein
MKATNKKQRGWMANACLGVVAMLCLAGCASSPAAMVLTKSEVDRITVPAALLAVDAEPGLPSSRMQSAAADYIVRLKVNDDQCHSDVAAIAATQQ